MRFAPRLDPIAHASEQLVLQTSFLFGVGHYHQGLTGLIDTAISTLILGALYVWSGRNLWAPILAHGLTDTIAIVVTFLGWIKV